MQIDSKSKLFKEKSESDWALVSATHENELKICEHFNWTSLFNLGFRSQTQKDKYSEIL